MRENKATDGDYVTLTEKIRAIQQLARKVPKLGTHEHGWQYMRVEDVVAIATRFMRSHELTLYPRLKSMTRTANERGGSIVDVIVSWELRDSEEMLIFDVPGSGFDYESKGTAKALTDSRKSAMILIFNLKGGDDPERAPVTRAAAKEKTQDIVDSKLANAAAGRGIDADVPKLFYEIFPESKTVELTGDKALLKSPVLKTFKLGGKFVVPAEKWDDLRTRIENEGVTLSNLRTQ